MKKIFPFLFVCLFCVSAAAQYPKDETIDPYPKPVREKTLVRRFECDDDASSRWKAQHHSTLAVSERRLRIESTGNDPYVLMPELPASEAGTFEVRIRMKNDMRSPAEFFWSTKESPDFRAENAVRFRFVPKDEWGVYAVRFETTAPPTRLRFDPGTSDGVCEIEWVELYKIEFDPSPENRAPWYDPDWAEKVERWKTVAADRLEVRFDEKGIGARIFFEKEHVGDIYPLVHLNPGLPLGGVPEIPLFETKNATPRPPASGPLSARSLRATSGGAEFDFPLPGNDQATGTLRFELRPNAPDEIAFRWSSERLDLFGPVFRPKGEMQQALLNGVEYLEKGEHSSSTADIESEEHLRFAPRPLDVTWPFMAIVTDKIGFGLLWDDPETQAIFATPDFICGDSKAHFMGLHGTTFSGTVKIVAPNAETKDETSVQKRRGRPSPQEPTPAGLNDLEELLLTAIRRYGLPELPSRFRDDEAQRLLNLAAFEKSIVVGPTGWRHAAAEGVAKQVFSSTYGNDFVSAVWQLSGTLPEVPRLDHGGGHLRNPASFLLTGKANEFLDWTRNEARHFLSQQKEDGSFRYSGKYLKGHWDDTASGHCGNALYRLMYDYRFLGDPDILPAARKGIDLANRFPTPRGAQVWELSLHTPDIMGSSRMCMANVLFYEATGEKKYLDAARRWAITGLPFVYLWTSEKIGAVAPGAGETTMKYATIPVFGATNWKAPNWIGLPVQWCGLDYGEALFMLAEHDRTVDWKKIAEGILIAAERMQYPDGPSVGLLPDAFVLRSQQRNPFDINPSVLVMQRRRLQGKLESVDTVRSRDGKRRIVAPYKATIETDGDGKSYATIEAVAGTTYQILVDGKEIRTIVSKGKDRVEL